MTTENPDGGLSIEGLLREELREMHLRLSICEQRIEALEKREPGLTSRLWTFITEEEPER